jgi:hypothetical protein
MIGKKSKFEEHERKSKSQVQDQENLNSTVGADTRKGQSEKGECSSGTSLDNIKPGKADTEHEERFVTESLSELGQGSEEQIEEIPEEIQQIEGKYTIPRSTGDSPGESKGKVEQPSEGKGTAPTILTPQNIKTDTDLLWDEICNGVKGKNSGIPMGFNRLNKYLGLRKSIYTTIGAAAGCGKTSLVDCAYVLNPYDWYIKNKHKATTNVQFEAIYFSMERKKTYKLAKWLCMKIWKEEHKLVTTDELLSWQNTLSPKIQEMAKFYIDHYFKEMTESGVVTIIDGQQNPTGIYKFLKAHALKKGKIEEISEFEHRYVPNNDNLITNVVHDHAGKTKNENIGGKYDKKLSIDKASEYYCWARDFLGYSPIMINQFNRTSYQDIQFAKKEGGDPDPTVEYWKDSGNVIEDCDVAISLFNPYKYSLEEYMGYTVNDFTDASGNNKFRGLKIIKNSYGTDNLRIGLGFLGEVSLFKELTKSKEISQKELNSVINNDFFLDF